MAREPADTLDLENGTMADETLIDRALRWEKETPDRVYLTQPLGQGRVRDCTWAQALDEARRMAAHLRSFGFPPGTPTLKIKRTAIEERYSPRLSDWYSAGRPIIWE